MTENRKSLEKYYNLWQETTVLYERWARRRGLTYNSLTVLIAVAGSAPASCTQKTICQDWALPKQTVNTILKDFAKKGLLELVPVEEDRRSKAIRLTEEGRGFCERTLGDLKRLELFIMEQMDPTLVDAMIGGMDLFCQYFRKGMELEHEAL
ncbi:MarR family transcriptional regulator [Faecalicatena contorta]|uniref:MarR family winged helix-turn-helix transcriptional regulator n=1 Tax=Faecalicatena contorta TaxID=39482 RepID=UPI00195FB848|nr:helix-turn-helix domain-containing protein [Faecalicatena contorta]MBM6686334.1 MarR family transcriptional regulator [Faecalicatena contorta]MBM6711677.1 MarR family transcriptional regulator [Faecalicatena contorta]